MALWVPCFVLVYSFIFSFVFLIRHGPFDIQGGGLGFLVRAKIFFFRQNRSKIIFFAGPSGRIIFFFFIAKSCIYNI